MITGENVKNLVCSVANIAGVLANQLFYIMCSQIRPCWGEMDQRKETHSI